MSDQLPKKNNLNDVVPSINKGSSGFSTKKANELKNKKKTKMLFSVFALLVLLIGGAIGLYMTKISQDLRQQADVGDYGPGDDVCTASGGKWVGNLCYMGGTATCDGPGSGGGDPCAANGGICSGTNTIRCKCGNSWVAGKAGSKCDDLCKEAGLDCNDSCTPTRPPGNPTTPPTRPPATPTPTPSGPPSPTPTTPPGTPTPTPTLPPGVTPTITPTPTLPPGVTPTITPTPTSTPTPVPSECGFTPCETNTDCNGSLTCVIANDGEGYCSEPDYENACFNNPGTEACCNEPTPTPTDVPGEEGGSSSYSYSESNSSATVNINNENKTTVAGGTTTNRYAPTEPTLPPELPKTGPEDWIKYLQIGLGTLGIGALLLLFL